MSGTPHGDHAHDHFGPADAAALASREGTRATWISWGLLALTAVLQLGVVAISGSVALLADTIHNFTDALTAIPLLIAFRLARRPPTRRYPYGYHRAEDVAGLTIVALIGVSALLAGAEAIRRLLHPQPIEAVGWVLAAGALGFLGNEAVAQYRIRVGKHIGAAALVADGMNADDLQEIAQRRPKRRQLLQARLGLLLVGEPFIDGLTDEGGGLVDPVARVVITVGRRAAWLHHGLERGAVVVRRPDLVELFLLGRKLVIADQPL